MGMMATAATAASTVRDGGDGWGVRGEPGGTNRANGCRGKQNSNFYKSYDPREKEGRAFLGSPEPDHAVRQ